MSLGWAKVPADEWGKVKTRPGQDRVPEADYEVVPESLRHIEARDGSTGAYILQLTTTENNSEEYQGKQLDYRMQYHPDPANSEKPQGYQRMNEISHQNAKAFCEAAGVEDQFDEQGQVDLIRMFELAVATKPRVVVSVTHRDDYQDVVNPRPAVT